MNAFESASSVSEKSFAILRPLIESRAFNGQYTVLAKGRLAKELQVSVGDLVLNTDAVGTFYSVELKAEQRATPNFFLEYWSNRSAYNPGWMWKLNADLLLYHFIDADDLYIINFQRLKRWFHACEQRGRPPSSEFVHCEQKSYDQRNDTWGALVPIVAVGAAIGFDVVHPARGLTDTRHFSAQRHEQTRLAL